MVCYYPGRYLVYYSGSCLQELLATMAETVSNGGNLLVNVGPTREGLIPAIMQERLRQMGDFLRINGEAVGVNSNITL